MNYSINIVPLVDEWLAEIPGLPGVMCKGPTREAAVREVVIIALRVIADNIELGKHPITPGITFLQVLP